MKVVAVYVLLVLLNSLYIFYVFSFMTRDNAAPIRAIGVYFVLASSACNISIYCKIVSRPILRKFGAVACLLYIVCIAGLLCFPLENNVKNAALLTEVYRVGDCYDNLDMLPQCRGVEGSMRARASNDSYLDSKLMDIMHASNDSDSDPMAYLDREVQKVLNQLSVLVLYY